MIGKETIKLHIICDKKTKEYANYLRQLISVNDDKEDGIIGVKDGSVETVVWSEEDYRNNEPTLSSNNHILFIGQNKTSKKETKNMVIKYDKFGMKYGWLGKRAMLQVDDIFLSNEEYREFISYCATYKQFFEKLAYQETKESEATKNKKIEAKDVVEVETVESHKILIKVENKMLKALSHAGNSLVTNILEPVGGFLEAGAKGALDGVKAHIVHKKIMDQQYRALTVIYYLDGLNEFLKG